MSAPFVHLTLRGRDARVLVPEEADWHALGQVAERMLFWCGGAIHGCRCEGNELHFALELAGASLAQVVRHLSGGYARHVRRRHGWTGKLFRRYRMVPVEVDSYWEDLVLWLHRPRTMEGPGNPLAGPCWTADAAYRTPGALPWITTALVLEALGGSGLPGYRRCLRQPIPPRVVALLTRPSRTRRGIALDASTGDPMDADRIVALVAAHAGLAVQDLLSASRRRSLSKARALATLLSARCGVSAAAMARLLGRTRSTLSEQVERYRRTQPYGEVDACKSLSMRGISRRGAATTPEAERIAATTAPLACAVHLPRAVSPP